MKLIKTQKEWMRRASSVFPAGGFGNFDPGVILKEGKGSRVRDEDGNEYVDLLIGSGPMIVGHGDLEVLEVVAQQLTTGMTFFTNNTAGIELAEVICASVSCAEQLRYVTSGSEADMYAMRLARAFTGRPKILKFEGGYHGMSAEAQMSLAPVAHVNFPTAVSDSGGIPQSVNEDVLIAPFNDIAFVQSIIAEHGPNIAGVIVEPLQRLIPPEPGFLQALRDACTKAGIVLIFDEIVTGFRLAYGGAQEAYGVEPDICTLGKVIGGGFALAAIVGKADIMACFDKAIVENNRWLMQLGTLSGNPIAAVAGLKTLEILRREGQYERLNETGRHIMQMHRSSLDKRGIPYQIVGEPALFDVVFSENPVQNYRNHQSENMTRNKSFNMSMRRGGVLKAPSKIYASLTLDHCDFQILENAIQTAATELH